MKIGIVNDLPMVAEALRRAVLLQPGYQVIWIARDGAEAVAQCARDRPDIILMDLIMPGMNGIEATRRIMAETPCAILVVTVNVGVNASAVFDAMKYGALDAVDTPDLGSRDPHAGAAALLAKLGCIARQIGTGTEMLRTIQLPTGSLPSRTEKHLVAIGASAGGPGAIAKLLGALPREFPASIIIIQHIDVQFSAGLAEWLSRQSVHSVRLAEAGDQPAIGTVLLARGNEHLRLTTTAELTYTSEPGDCAYRPSIDVFFQSVCQFWPHDATGVLLTGMGRDGAAGLKSLRDKGYHTIAQDEASSTVYGMPKAAARLDAADEILPLEQIAPSLAAIVFPSDRSRAVRR
ncbi:MAG: chemotaxis response regulator protein-glutamate methylesterase [Gammaproteobacteria bacterium]|nr:chemotaxis response regulator protein-glutamate methylesterase [Gammaproteobacteria bacterium]